MTLNDNYINQVHQFRGKYLWIGKDEGVLGVLGAMGVHVIGQTERDWMKIGDAASISCISLQKLFG